MSVGPSGGSSYGQDHRQTQGDCEVEVELGAEIVITVAAAVGRLRRHRASEEGGTDVAKVESRRAGFGEAQGRQVDLARDPSELARGDFVDVETGKAFQFAVPFLSPVIDVIVAESANVISRQRAEARAAAYSGVRVYPGGAVAPR